MTTPSAEQPQAPPTSTPPTDSDSDMSLRTTTLISNLSSVTARITAAASSTTTTTNPTPPRLVAVSKLKPASDIRILHNHNPSLHFGENYLQELLEKSKLLAAEGLRIKWHFIGGLQSNKCVTLARDVVGLWAVESVDSVKKAGLLEKGWGEREREMAAQQEGNNDVLEAEGGDGDEGKLRVFVQVNTSGEASKSGVEPGEAVTLCRYVHEECPRLKLQGLMTIGAIARSRATTVENENEDFECLRGVRGVVEKELGVEGLELSMGMSEDFEGAIRMGSNQVRVGSTIFGTRPPKEQARVV
ncbi:hypothetical protein FQN53_009724 [Emmonsiellopsis sp. PD_33]|nr:hypothetical protein FQN53_009724 [Emmonsiellopsis sp. PD_33]KAK2794242.1 hypothetical protein FQN51_000876 [Onygenales sp. PD_10]